MLFLSALAAIASLEDDTPTLTLDEVRRRLADNDFTVPTTTSRWGLLGPPDGHRRLSWSREDATVSSGHEAATSSSFGSTSSIIGSSAGHALPAAGIDLFCISRIAIPQVFLLGAQKCSTSSLASQLHTEAHTVEGFSKESHFFDGPNGDGDRASIMNWANRFGRHGCGPSVVAFDSTPNYVLDYANNNVNERARFLGFIRACYGTERLSQMTFVMVLCDPVQRAQSYE